MEDVWGWRVAIALLNLLITVLVAMVRSSVVGISNTMDQATAQLRQINGKVGKLEQWAEDHEKQDDETRSELRTLQQRIGWRR